MWCGSCEGSRLGLGGWWGKRAGTLQLRPHITRLSGDVPPASLLGCSGNKLSATGKLLDVRVLVSLVFGTKPNSIKAISGSAVMWLVALSSPLFGGTRGRREFAVPLTTSDFLGNARAKRRQPEWKRVSRLVSAASPSFVGLSGGSKQKHCSLFSLFLRSS